MRLFSTVWLICIASAIHAQDDPKDKLNADKLVGTWQLVKSDEQLPDDVVFFVDLAADGKMSVRMEMKGTKESITMKGKYKVDGNKIDYTLMLPGGEKKQEILTIKKLTDNELITVDPDGIKEEFKRVKIDKKPIKD